MKAITTYNVKENYYFITEEGKLISSYQNKELSLSLDKDGYARPSLRTKDSKSVRVHLHRLVLSTFSPVDNWENLEVNHKDGNKLNNCLSNLEWVTTKENIQHAWKTGLSKGGENHSRARMTEKQAIYALRQRQIGKSVIEIAKELGVGRGSINSLVHGRTWKHLTQGTFNDYPEREYTSSEVEKGVPRNG